MEKLHRTRAWKEPQSFIVPKWSGTHGAREVLTLEYDRSDRLWNIRAYFCGDLVVDLHYGNDAIGLIWEQIKVDKHFFTYQNELK